MVVGGALALVGSLLFLTAMFMMKFDFNNLSIPNESPTETVQEFSGDVHSLRIEDNTADGRYDDMMQDFHAYIQGIKTNPFSYQHDYLVQRVLDTIVGGIRFNGQKMRQDI